MIQRNCRSSHSYDAINSLRNCLKIWRSESELKSKTYTHTVYIFRVRVCASFEKLSTNWWMSGKIICACTIETITCFRSRSIIDSLHLTQSDFYLETLKWRNIVIFFLLFTFHMIFNEHAIYFTVFFFFREEKKINIRQKPKLSNRIECYLAQFNGNLNRKPHPTESCEKIEQTNKMFGQCFSSQKLVIYPHYLELLNIIVFKMSENPSIENVDIINLICE